MAESMDVNLIYSEIVDWLTYESFQKDSKFKKATIIIADDSNSMRRMLLKRLETKNVFEIVEAKNGVEALYMLGKYSDTVRLIFLDIVMPFLDGPEFFLKTSKAELLKETPVVLTVPAINKRLLIEMVRRGVFSYMLYPFTEAQLFEMIRDAIMKKRRGITELLEDINNIHLSGRATMVYNKINWDTIDSEEGDGLSRNFENSEDSEKIKYRNLNEHKDDTSMERQNLSYKDTAGNAELLKQIDKEIVNKLESEKTYENNLKLFYINELLKSKIVDVFIDYLKSNDYKLNDYSDFSYNIENTDSFDIQSKKVLDEFDNKGLQIIYSSDKELFNKLFNSFTEKKKSDDDLNSDEEIKKSILYYFSVYWNYILRKKIQNVFFAEYLEARKILDSANINKDRIVKNFEALFSKWKQRLSSGILKMQNLKSADVKEIKQTIDSKI